MFPSFSRQYKYIVKKEIEKDLEQCIYNEHLRLRMTGAKELSKQYRVLVQKRQQSDSSPRSVGALPASPTKGKQSELPREEIERRSPLDMKLNFLAYHASEKNTVHPYYRVETKPVPIPGTQEVAWVQDRQQAVAASKVAFGLSVLRPSYMPSIQDSQDTSSSACYCGGIA